MRLTLAVASVATALAVSSLAAAGPALESVASCRAALAADPRGRPGAECLYEAARTRGVEAPAARELARLAAAHPEAPWLLFFYGRTLWWHAATVANAHIESAASLFALQAEPAGEIRARASLMTLAGFASDFEGAGEQLGRVRALVERHPTAEHEAIGHVAEAHYEMLNAGDLGLAYVHLGEARDRYVANARDYPGLFECLRALVSVALDLGLGWEALTYAEEAEELAAEHGTPHDVVSTAYNKLHASLRVEAPTEGRRLRRLGELEKLLDKAVAAGHGEVEAQARRLLAEMAGGPGAGEHLALCQDRARRLQDRDLERRCILAMGSFHVESDPLRAMQLLAEAYTMGLDRENPWASLYGWSDHLRVLWGTRARDRALAEGEVVLGSIEALREAQVGGARDRVLSAWADAFYWVAGRLLERGQGDENQSRENQASEDQAQGEDQRREDQRRAFAIIERLRAQTLREVLSLEAKGGESLPSDLVERQERVRASLVKVYRSLLDPRLGVDERAELMARLEEVEQQEALLRSAIAARFPSSLALEPPTLDLLERVQARLADDEALLSFQLGLWRGWDRRFLGGAWLLVVTRGDVRAYRLEGDRATLELNVRRVVSLRHRTSPQALARLGRDVFGRALADLPRATRRLVLVPDGPLHLLPFSLLRVGPDGPPLVDRFELSVVPSASLWLEWRRAATETGARPPAALVLANPQLAARGPSAASRAWSLSSGANLGSLQFAEEEGRSVLERLGGAGRLLVGNRASEALLKAADLGAFSILHLAAHAVVDPDNPDRSAILLAAGDARQDGFLRPPEIAALEGLDGDLVVLSACESGVGDVLRGEGVLSLARAFFEAGAHTVISSLWPIDDREAARFVDDLYRHLGRGMTVGRALAETQREWIAEGRRATTWAGFVVLGDADLTPVPGGVPSSAALRPAVVALILGLVLVALAVFLGLRARRRP